MKRFWKAAIFALVCFSFFFISCDNPLEPDNGDDVFEVFFTDPTGYEDLMDRATELIGGAEQSIYVATYLFELTEISEALIEAHNAGIDVRVVCERENYDDDPQNCFYEMENAGIEVVPDNGGGAMHNKFIIFDEEIVWAGSSNLTYNGFHLNCNNTIIIRSISVADEFLHEFSQMFTGSFQGAKTSNGVEEISVGDGSVTVIFGPQESPQSRIIDEIENADSVIKFCIYAFTVDDIADAFIDAHNRGVQVMGIFDNQQIYDTPTTYFDLQAAGVDVYESTAPYAFHHKFILIDPDEDNATVITSSGNWSNNGMFNNDENFVIIQSESVAEDFSNEFARWQVVLFLSHLESITCDREPWECSFF